MLKRIIRWLRKREQQEEDRWEYTPRIKGPEPTVKVTYPSDKKR